MGGTIDYDELVNKLGHGNETEITEILLKLGIGFYDSQTVVERIMYQKSIHERLAIVHELYLNKAQYKECMESYIPPNSTSGKFMGYHDHDLEKFVNFITSRIIMFQKKQSILKRNSLEDEIHKLGPKSIVMKNWTCQTIFTATSIQGIPQ